MSKIWTFVQTTLRLKDLRLKNLRRNVRWPRTIGVVVLLLGGSVAIVGAQQAQRIPSLPDMPFNYSDPPLPNHFNNQQITNADNTPANNPITDEGATLGRVLFYDPLLSANDTVSCSSCHLQEHGFSDPAAFSVGFDGSLTGRNSMGLTNARYYENGHFFWDERADTLEEQVLLPIQDPIEMGLTLSELETKLAATDYYPDLFEDAFGTPDITSERVSLALAQFVRAMVSYQSKYDEGVGQNFANFTAQENLGRQIFEGNRGGCDNCHGTALQIADEPDNNGLDATTTDAGAGNGQFKVPSLRNVELTAPYMHDGRFATLAEVVDHYNSGVQAHPNLARQLRNRGGGPVQPRRLNLTQNEMDAMVAFMRTLTDNEFITSERFSDPFVDVIVTPSPTSTPLATATPTPTSSAAPPSAATATPTTNPENETEEANVRPGRPSEVRFDRRQNRHRLVMNLPTDALQQETTLTYTRLDRSPITNNEEARFADVRFTLTAVQNNTRAIGFTFLSSVRFQVAYPQPDNGLDEGLLQLFVLDEDADSWVLATCGTESIDAQENRVESDVCQTGEFALFATSATTIGAGTPNTTPGDASELSEAVYMPWIVQ